jgi:hypothetical protein
MPKQIGEGEEAKEEGEVNGEERRRVGDEC